MADDTTQHDSEQVVALDILALDDDPDFREYIQGLLAGDGHTIRTVSTPSELYAKAQEARPDVILLDMNMGVHTGEEVLREINERWVKQCVIVVTGYPSLDSMRETFKQDVFDYLAKPFSIVELRAALMQAAQEFGLGQNPIDRLRAALGRQIRLARTERGWTLRELSASSSISISQLSSIERGTHLPSVESLISIATALKATPSAWFATAGF